MFCARVFANINSWNDAMKIENDRVPNVKIFSGF